jgi:hypothetical protein
MGRAGPHLSKKTGIEFRSASNDEPERVYGNYRNFMFQAINDVLNCIFITPDSHIKRDFPINARKKTDDPADRWVEYDRRLRRRGPRLRAPLRSATSSAS